jgi:methionyl-tRNA formyltransferase
MKLQASPVKQWALEHGVPVAQPRSLRLDGQFPEEAAQGRAAIEAARDAGATIMVVAAYGLILPQWVLDTVDCLNIHASLLPRWRGAAPIHRALEAGDEHSGVTIMQMEAGLDTGPMWRAESLAIAPDDTTASLHDRLAPLGGELMVRVLADFGQGTGPAQPTPQPTEGVCYAQKIEKSEALIDWALPAETIERRVRAFDPFPGAHTQMGDEVIKVWQAQAVRSAGPARSEKAAVGEILVADELGIWVQCGEGVLKLSSLQRAGGKRLPVADFMRGFPLHVGQVLGGKVP